MKTISLIGKMPLAVAFLFMVQSLFAQAAPEKSSVQKFQLCLVKEEKGNKEIIDKTFASKEEMDAYIKENNIESPETSESASKTSGQTDSKQKSKPGKNAIKKEKKIIIIEKDESGLSEKTDFEIDLTNLSAQESAALVQDIINEKVGTLAVVNTRNELDAPAKPGSLNKEEEGPHTGINPNPANLSNLKVYPNPSNNEFHVAFTIAKPCNIKMSLSDMQGREVYAEVMNNYSGNFEKNISRAGLSKGTYLMAIEAGSEKETTTVVMQ